MENLDALTFIRASTLFRNLQPDELAAVVSRLHPTHFARETRIMERGVWHGTLYIIGSGRVRVALQDEDMPDTLRRRQGRGDDEGIVARLGEGECFGEMSLITGEPPSASVRAEEDTEAWALTHADFLTLVGSCPTLSRNINTILSLRLARTNQQLLLSQSAERIWLASLDDTTSPVERSLVVHIAAALAARTRKRVLLLECCDQGEAIGPHFARYPEQLRPSLADCAHEHNLLQAHRAPTMQATGEYYPAIASLTSTSPDTHSGSSKDLNRSDVLSSVPDLAACYEYILLVTTPTTPAAVTHAVSRICSRAIILLPADQASHTSPLQSIQTKMPTTLFITHVTEPPTIGQMDHYSSLLNTTVTRLLPTGPGQLTQCWEQNKWLYELSGQDGVTRGVDFVARLVARQTVGITFGGGGARGFAHLGVLERLLQHGVPVDYISASSSGIITPGMYLIGKSFEESEEIFLQIQRKIVQWRIPRTSLFSNQGLKQMLHELCGELRFEDLTTPFAMVAVDLATRAGVVLDRGPLWQAGLASVALPGIFPPVMIGEHILMDAGMHDPVPVRLARKMGADILIASELGGQEPPGLESATPWLAESEVASGSRKTHSPHIVDLLLRSYDLAMATIGMHSVREADLVIRPRLHRVSLRQFSEGRKFVAAGREAVEQELPFIQQFLPWIK